VILIIFFEVSSLNLAVCESSLFQKSLDLLVRASMMFFEERFEKMNINKNEP
jgi:hypothetical protein